MTHACQLTEISLQDFPELFRFYQYSPEKYPFLLSTTSQQEDSDDQHCVYDILFIEPQAWLTLNNKHELNVSESISITSTNDFLDAFNAWYLEQQDKASSIKNTQYQGDLPFTGGWFIFLAYELAQQIEPCLKLPMDNQVLPVACAARVKQALIFDHRNKKLFFVSEPDLDHKQAYDLLIADSKNILETRQEKLDVSALVNALNEEDEHSFLNSVDVVNSYIKEGDVFQVNLSRLWQTDYSPFLNTDEGHNQLVTQLYQQLSIANPAPFSGMASFTSEQGIATIISSSPERLLKIKDDFLESRPIAGTRPRSTFEREDLRLMDELHKHPKEQAEHIMLIDLIRNDLGRVCQPGTVKVNELMVNESYAHVHHIVSNVIGRIQPNKTPSDAIRAMFPGGTITGCPKVRCMEIIAELEQQSRGAYTGSMGYINLDGSMDLNILIRTMVLEQSLVQDSDKIPLQRLSFRAGAGLVYDSVAKKELQETRAKVKGLLRALQV